jgi:hypothetical protein
MGQQEEPWPNVFIFSEAHIPFPYLISTRKQHVGQLYWLCGREDHLAHQCALLHSRVSL